jgi:hypothetical protein
MLVQRNAPLNVQNVDGDTPLHWACKASKTAVIKVRDDSMTTHPRSTTTTTTTSADEANRRYWYPPSACSSPCQAGRAVDAVVPSK